jgi:hypothetical protein
MLRGTNITPSPLSQKGRGARDEVLESFHVTPVIKKWHQFYEAELVCDYGRMLQLLIVQSAVPFSYTLTNPL